MPSCSAVAITNLLRRVSTRLSMELRFLTLSVTTRSIAQKKHRAHFEKSQSELTHAVLKDQVGEHFRRAAHKKISVGHSPSTRRIFFAQSKGHRLQNWHFAGGTQTGRRRPDERRAIVPAKPMGDRRPSRGRHHLRYSGWTWLTIISAAMEATMISRVASMTLCRSRVPNSRAQR
jgi:hypothetical protein